MQIPPLPLDRMRKAIKSFNEDYESLALDRIVDRCFADLSPDDDRSLITERVVAIDKLWATQMFRRQGHTEKVIESIHRNWGTIVEASRSLTDDAIEHRPEQVTSVAMRLLPIVMGYDEPPTPPSYLPYSFATKFLHWTTRRHFPVMDSFARCAIRTMYNNAGMKPSVRSEWSGWPPDYPVWIDFYSRLICSIPQADRDALIDFDYELQPKNSRHRHTLLRVLDKAFYWELDGKI